MDTERKDFIGGLVASILVKKGVEVAIEKGMDRLARSPSISLKEKDAQVATGVVAAEVKKEVTEQVIHKTNSEPIIQSRVAQGSVGGVLMAVAIIVQYWTDGVAQGPVEYTPPALVIVGACWALYGRFIAKKAFGVK